MKVGIIMVKNDFIEQSEQVILHTYNRYPLVIERGEGVYLYDSNGKKYLDFASGIAVFALGYHYKDFDQTLKDQIDKILHTSNLFYNDQTKDAAKAFVKASGMSRVFFTNSGAEAIEGALKAAKKYAFKKKNKDCFEVIAMKNSFHGRTLGALSVTGNEKYREPFEPLLPGVKFAEFNNLESVKCLVNDRTCAIIVEPVQGEGGIFPAKEEFLTGLRKICNEKDIILIFDEIQCGMGRTGTMFAYQGYQVLPDVVTSAKGLGCGVPVGAFALSEKIFSCSLTAGDHGSTYGGNPFVCAAVKKVFDFFEKDNIVEHVGEISRYFEEKLEELVNTYEVVELRRGIGLIQGLLLKIDVASIIKESQELGLIIISAGPNVLRFVPPLIISKQHVDEMIHILKVVFDKRTS